MSGINPTWKKTMLKTVVAVATFAFFFCDGPIPVPGTITYDPGLSAPNGIFAKATMTYYAVGDTLILIGQGCSCVKDTAILIATKIKYRYVLGRNLLELFIPRIDPSATAYSSAVSLHFNRLWGETLVGGWMFNADSLIISGDATNADSQKCRIFQDSLVNLKSCWLEIKTDQFILNTLPDTGKFAADFSAEWKDTLAKSYNAAIRTIKSDSLNIIFNTTQDTVRISRNVRKELTTSTTVGSYGKVINRYKNLRNPNNYKFSDDGSSCPALKYPDWLTQGFLLLNKRN
jgi:hypothetical protein